MIDTVLLYLVIACYFALAGMGLWLVAECLFELFIRARIALRKYRRRAAP
jgi:type IV secretory pathway TrbD component